MNGWEFLNKNLSLIILFCISFTMIIIYGKVLFSVLKERKKTKKEYEETGITFNEQDN